MKIQLTENITRKSIEKETGLKDAKILDPIEKCENLLVRGNELEVINDYEKVLDDNHSMHFFLVSLATSGGLRELLEIPFVSAMKKIKELQML